MRSNGTGSEQLVECCGYCGQELVQGALFCHHCGAQVLRDDMRPAFTPPPAQPVLRVPSPHPSASAPQDFGTGPSEQGSDLSSQEWVGRPSPRCLVLGVLKAALWSLPVLTGAELLERLAGGLHPVGQWLLLAALALIWFRQLGPALRCYTTARYRVEPGRLWIEEGFLKRVVEKVDLTRVADVRVRQNLLERFLGVGHLELYPLGQHGQRWEINWIENCDIWARKLDQLARRQAPGQQRTRPAPVPAET
jgi:membrane protein YdbS with pleckstrin-like domain